MVLEMVLEGRSVVTFEGFGVLGYYGIVQLMTVFWNFQCHTPLSRIKPIDSLSSSSAYSSVLLLGVTNQNMDTEGHVSLKQCRALSAVVLLI